ncbi:redoxin family protein [Crateriforma spongiae]|uniref:redoxin family protein n=1 Tax=Crateriforma spongiae TaxID=2724528 RepID=UPI0039AEEF4D
MANFSSYHRARSIAVPSHCTRRVWRRAGMVPIVAVLLAVLRPAIAIADDPKTQTPSEVAESDVDLFELDQEVQSALFPLFEAISQSRVSRSTIQLTTETTVGGRVVDAQVSTYQIASKTPDQFTVYLKETDQRTRIFNNAEKLTVALSSDAYVEFDEPISIRQAVDGLPVPMGPYPEPVLAMTLAGYDPAIALVGGMKSIQLVDRAPFRGETPAVHLKGVQDDLVQWDLWLLDRENELQRPLRMIVDLTDMLRSNQQMKMPAGYRYQLRFDFLSWRISGDVDEKLFTYQPPNGAKKYPSVDTYFQSLAGISKDHPLLGKDMPEFASVTLDGKGVRSQDLKNKVVVLSFWATWCTPCLESMPTLQSVTERYEDKDVVFYAVNVGESADKVVGFLSEQPWQVPVMLDAEGEIADAFKADAIPQRILIGKSGKVESVQLGYQGAEALEHQLTDELDVLHIGGRIATSKSNASQDKAKSDAP